eukprot:2747450-Pyramimonas_sp.AAC.2
MKPPELALPFEVNESDDDSKLVIARWEDGDYWEMNLLTVGKLRSHRALEFKKNPGGDPHWTGNKDNVDWKLVYRTDRSLLLSIQSWGPEDTDWVQRLQLVIGHMTDDEKAKAIDGLKHIAVSMMEGSLTKEDADIKKLEYAVKPKRIPLKRRPAAGGGGA